MNYLSILKYIMVPGDGICDFLRKTGKTEKVSLLKRAGLLEF
jgi:hypothetical protein